MSSTDYYSSLPIVQQSKVLFNKNSLVVLASHDLRLTSLWTACKAFFWRFIYWSNPMVYYHQRHVRDITKNIYWRQSNQPYQFGPHIMHFTNQQMLQVKPHKLKTKDIYREFMTKVKDTVKDPLLEKPNIAIILSKTKPNKIIADKRRSTNVHDATL